MSLRTNLHGRLRNTNLPKSHGLQPVFETVVNSIHALEEKGNLNTTGKVVLSIIRYKNYAIEPIEEGASSIEGFTVEDNGIGFNDANFASFEMLDSEHKIDKGCKGVGRLLWLKAFKKVEINSLYKHAEDAYKSRVINFDAWEGVKLVNTKEEDKQESKTLVRLLGFEKKYREASPKNIDSISSALLEHCLWYFVRPEGVPKIIVSDGDRLVCLNDLYNLYMYDSAHSEKITIKDCLFELTHIKFRASSAKKHGVSLCAAGRLVKEEVISGKIPGLYGRISDGVGEFVYNCYVASSYLDEHVRTERTSFDIVEKAENDIFSGVEISLSDIREQV